MDLEAVLEEPSISKSGEQELKSLWTFGVLFTALADALKCFWISLLVIEHCMIIKQGSMVIILWQHVNIAMIPKLPDV